MLLFNNSLQGGVHCLQFDQDILVTGSWDKSCLVCHDKCSHNYTFELYQVWDVVHYTIIGLLQGHTERVSCLKFDGTTM